MDEEKKDEQLLGMDVTFEHMSFTDSLKAIYFQGQYMLTHLQMILEKVKTIQVQKVKELFCSQTMYADVSKSSDGFINGVSMVVMLLVTLNLLSFILNTLGSLFMLILTPFSLFGSLFSLLFSLVLMVGIAALCVWGISRFYKKWTSFVLKIVTAGTLVFTLFYFISLISDVTGIFKLGPVFQLSIFGGLIGFILILVKILFHAAVMTGFAYMAVCATDSSEIPDA